MTSGAVPAALELALHPEDLPLLLRSPTLARLRTAPARGAAARIVWHDTADGSLARGGLALAERRGLWRLERMQPDRAPWPPGTPAPLVSEAPTAAAAAPDISAPLIDLVVFEGRQKSLCLREDGAEMSLLLLHGALRGVARERPCCRMTLRGPSGPLGALSERLAGEVRLFVPRAALAAEAIALARGLAPPPRRLGAPEVAEGDTAGAAFAAILAHLADVILHWSASAGAGAAPEPVHQMRVAVRRLRSALGVFRRAADGPCLGALGEELRALAGRLGAARNWDVFLSETAPPVRDAFPADRRIARLLDAAGRRRKAAYAALAAELDGPGFRRLGLHLAQAAALRPWEAEAGPERAGMLAQDVGTYARKLLTRRHDRMLAVGEALAPLPAEALHELRKDAKRLRYACEFFAPLHPGKPARRFLRRLAALQEALGGLNDAVTAAGLTGQLGGGPDLAFARGAMEGFVAARNGELRAGIDAAWAKFRRQDRFWR